MKFWLWLRRAASALFLVIVVVMWWLGPNLTTTAPGDGRPAPVIVK